MFHSLLGGGILLVYSLILLFLGMLLLLFYNLGLINIFKMNRIFTYGWCRFIYKLPHLTNHSICSIKINFFLRIENCRTFQKRKFFLKNSKFRRISMFYNARGAKNTHLSATFSKQKRKL